VRCIAVGSGKEALLARGVVRSVPGRINLAGQLSLPELAALMDRLSLFVCHDTGPLHVACARTTPLLALLGPTRPERTGPWPDLPRFTMLRGERMRGLAVEEAERAALQKLDAPDESSGRANGDQASGDQASPNPTARLSGPARQG